MPVPGMHTNAHLQRISNRRTRTGMRRSRDAFYKLPKWESKREKILRRDGYMCQISKRYGKRVAANVVHHIYPLEDYPQYALCNWNLISLSNAVHNRMHDRVTGKLTQEGLALMRRTKIPREDKDND